MSAGTVTVASRVKPPTRYVTLKYLFDADGLPLVVGCDPVSDDALFERLGLPGLRPPTVDDGTTPVEVQRRESRLVMEAAVEGGTFLTDEEGRQVRPAFTFGTEAKPGSLPGRWLRMEDLVALATAVLQAGGYVSGGPADAAAQFRGERAGDAGGGAALAHGAGAGPEPAGGGE